MIHASLNDLWNIQNNNILQQFAWNSALQINATSVLSEYTIILYIIVGRSVDVLCEYTQRHKIESD